MTLHAEDALRSPRISEILDLLLAIAAFEAIGTEGLISGENGKVLDLVAAIAAAVCTIIADEGAITEEK